MILPVPVYTPEERQAARVIASLIYADYPLGPDLQSDSTCLGLYTAAVDACRDPYETARVLGATTGKLYDCPGDAAVVWEGLRMMTGAATPYAKIDPLIRALGGAADARALDMALASPQFEERAARKLRGPAPTRESDQVDYVVDLSAQGVTLADLQYKQFPDERWIVENILPEGACLFAAKYKSKKSWLALALSLAVSMGGRALGRLAVEKGRVLYLDLEGRQQRIQKRTRAMLGVRQVDWPSNFHLFTKWEQGDAGMRDLEHWLMAHEDTALVVIDVLASFRRPMDRSEEIYRYDRDTIDPINALAERYHVAILLVHHFNKAKNDDIMDSITGSTGIPSAVNTMWGLRRDVNDSNITIMELRGRDLENEDPIALKWDSYLNQHVIEGPAAEVSISSERKAILALLADDEPRTPKEIAAALGRSVESVQQLLRKLINDGLIDKPTYGKYALVRHLDQTDQTDQSHKTDQTDHSDRQSDRSESDQSLDGVVLPQNGINCDSDRSDRVVGGFWDRVPEGERFYLRAYLRGARESDQETARKRCEAYGIDYDQARACVQRGE